MIEPEIFHTKVVGVTFEGRQYALQALERLNPGDKEKVSLSMRREKDNEYDPNAIAVDVTYFDGTFLCEVTKPLGYIKKEIAQSLADEMESGAEFDIIDFETTGGYTKTRGVNITILRKEAGMARITAMDLLNKKSGAKGDWKDKVLSLAKDSMITVRFLQPLELAYISATHSFEMPAGWGGKKWERFECLKYLNQDDTVDCPADRLDNAPWVRLYIPVIDRTDGKVKLFRETVATFRQFKIFEESPATDAERAFKLGGVTNADLQIIQIGSGREKKVQIMPVPGTIRPLTAEEQKLPLPNPKDVLTIYTKEEIQRIVDFLVQNRVGAETAAATHKGPFED